SELAWLPEPKACPGPPALSEVTVPGALEFAGEPNNVLWTGVRAKTPATTSTTAPATARAGRSQAIAWPTEMRDGELAWRGRFAEARASMPPTTAPAADPDRIVLNQDWHRTASTQPMVAVSLRSSHHCRLSHGSASRAWIFLKPSPT